MVELKAELNSEYDIYKERNASHIFLNSPLPGIVITDIEQKLSLNDTQFALPMFGGFSFDAVNHRIYWDLAGNYGRDLPATFIGDAGLRVTAGISGSATLTMILKINGVTILETPLTYNILNSIQGYGANSLLVDSSNDNLLQSGSYYEIWAKAGTGESLTVTLSTLNVTIKRD